MNDIELLRKCKIRLEFLQDQDIFRELCDRFESYIKKESDLQWLGNEHLEPLVLQLLPLIPLDEVVARAFIRNCCLTGKTLADIKENLEKYSFDEVLLNHSFKWGASGDGIAWKEIYFRLK